MEENGRTVDALEMAHIRFSDRHGIDSRQAVLACKKKAQPVAVATVAHRQAELRRLDQPVQQHRVGLVLRIAEIVSVSRSVSPWTT